MAKTKTSNYDVIIPEMIAERVVNDAGEFVKMEDADKAIDFLCDKYETLYKSGGIFTQQMEKKSDPRPFVYGFMAHWLGDFLKLTPQQNLALVRQLNG